MEHDRHKWIEDVLESAKGSERAKPDPGLFAKIENKIGVSEAPVISMQQWSMLAAAGVLLLLLNIFTIRSYNQNSVVYTQESTTEVSETQQLISNYNLYE